MQAWFGDRGDGIHNGGPSDPRLALLAVSATDVVYGIQDKVNSLTKAFNIAKGALTGEVPHVQSMREVSTSELNTARTSIGNV